MTKKNEEDNLVTELAKSKNMGHTSGPGKRLCSMQVLVHFEVRTQARTRRGRGGDGSRTRSSLVVAERNCHYNVILFYLLSFYYSLNFCIDNECSKRAPAATVRSSSCESSSYLRLLFKLSYATFTHI